MSRKKKGSPADQSARFREAVKKAGTVSTDTFESAFKRVVKKTKGKHGSSA